MLKTLKQQNGALRSKLVLQYEKGKVYNFEIQPLAECRKRAIGYRSTLYVLRFLYSLICGAIVVDKYDDRVHPILQRLFNGTKQQKLTKGTRQALYTFYTERLHVKPNT
jgi:hypothetical protein